MKIRFTDQKGRVYSGTPIQIVERMRSLCHQPSKTLEEYIRRCCERSVVLKINITYSGRNDEERCLYFLVTLLKDGYAKIDLEKYQSPDKYTIITIRKALDLSQERFAEQLRVSFVTVNRWERGKTRPRSLAHIRNIIKLSGQVGK